MLLKMEEACTARGLRKGESGEQSETEGANEQLQI